MKHILSENQHGNGAIKRNPIHRWWRRTTRPFVAKSVQPFDWSTTVDNSVGITIKDQGTSGSCGGQAGSYWLQIVNKCFPISAKSIYSLIYYPDEGGTTVSALETQIGTRGGALESLVPSYDIYGAPLTEAMYENTAWESPITIQDSYSRAGYLPININIDTESLAEAIRDYGAIIVEVQGQNGQNPGWLSPIPTPPSKTNQNEIWAHFLCCVGVMTKDGAKVLKFVNSWGTDVGEAGCQYFNEAYINSGYIVDAFTFYPAKNIASVPSNLTPQWYGIWLWFRQQVGILKSFINNN